MKCGEVYDSKNVQNHIVNEQNRLFTRSLEPEYSDDEVHLGLESFIGHLAKIDNPKCSQKQGRADLFKRAG
jgi:hypothetical protein